MKGVAYLVVQGKKYQHVNRERTLGSIKITKNKPSTNSDEIAVRLDLEIPDSLFEKPSLQVGISVPDLVKAGSEITADVQANIADIIKRETGLTVSITAVEEDQA